MHDLHEELYAYNKEHILQDGCRECEQRVNLERMGSLDPFNFMALWNEMLARDLGVGEQRRKSLSDLDRKVMTTMYHWALLSEKNFGRWPETGMPHPFPDDVIAVGEREAAVEQLKLGVERERMVVLDEARDEAHSLIHEAQIEADSIKTEVEGIIVKAEVKAAAINDAATLKAATMTARVERVEAMRSMVDGALESQDLGRITDAVSELFAAAGQQ